ncbi:negative regulator of sigma E activity [Luteimonas sp. J16]|jgi:negative regulator of sigma E activity|uniref:RseA family anti-sigma factor n=1 Tax=unclassified Luteimonas TaxID=2629088 RepID=UPI0004AF7765|nr:MULTISPECIES: RseA family anti-sigma factor [unclassified Luteimonas]TWG94539.1 negative regulator of sigma E activity [Luteimonas sp. J16]
MIHVDDNEPVQIRPDPDKLFLYHRQQLSAMLDGELSPDEARFMLRRLQHDTVLAAYWERWQLCGDVLRGQRNDLLPPDFARRVADALAGDTAAEAQSPAGRTGPRLGRWGGGAAIAASVALLAVFATRQLPAPGEVAPGPAQAAPLVAEAGRTAPVVPSPADREPVRDAVADATPAPAPAPVLAEVPEAGAMLAASAAALAETPRRAAERRARAQSPAVARGTRAEPAPAPSQATPAVPDEPATLLAAVPSGGPSAETSHPFPMPSAEPRPWPRSLLPSPSGYAVSGGGLAPRERVFEPFLPAPAPVLRWPPPDDVAEAPAADGRRP